MHKDSTSDEIERSPAALSDLLTFRDICAYIADPSLSRGRRYQRDGRVTRLYVSPDFETITATVEGSSLMLYQQAITLLPLANSKLKISGNCSCPMGFNCKHIAAVLIEALNRSSPRKPEVKPAEQTGVELRDITSPSLMPLPWDVENWLEELARHTVGDEYPADIAQRLLYVLSPLRRTNPGAHLAVEIIAARLLKSGEFSTSVTRPVINNYPDGNYPKYFRAADSEICQGLMLSAPKEFNQGPRALRSFNLLRKMVETGRTYWQDTIGKPLTMGEPRSGEIEWVMPDARGLRPFIKVDDGIALNAEPPVYVDARRSLIGPIELPVPPSLAYRLLNAPAIAPAHVEQVGKALSRHLPREVDLLPKTPEPPESVDEIPVAMLRLMKGNDAVNSYYYAEAQSTGVARLSFRYGPVKVAFGETSMLLETFANDRRYQVKRRPKFERETAGILSRCGLRPAREAHPLLTPEHRHDFAFVDGLEWLDFLARDTAALEKKGFEILIDDDFPFQVAIPSGELETELFEGSGLDWFELGMGIQVDGQKVELAPLLAQLVLGGGDLDAELFEHLAEDDGDIFVPMKDGRHLALATRRFLPIVIALHEFTTGGTKISDGGRLRVSKAETALLSTLEREEGLVFKGSEKLRALARSLSSDGAGLQNLTLPDEFQATLRPYQAHGVAWLNLLREVGLGGILADDMGLGKTVQILALLSLEKAQGRLIDPVLIVAPTSLMTNWQNEARKFAPALKVLVLHGAARKGRFEDIRSHDIVLTTYPLIARDQSVLMNQQWHMAILDEAQVIKNPNSGTTQIIRNLKAAHRFCLTGTPMENHLGELWSLMSFVNPGYLGDKTGFTRRWRTPIEKHSDAERSRLLARRVKPFILRRTKQEVAAELPPKTEINESIVLEDLQREFYDAIRLSMHEKVRRAIASKGFAKSHIIILEALLKLRQVCCDPRLLKLPESTSSPQARPASAKLERLMDMLDSLLAEGRKIIVFSQFTSMLRLIEERLQASKITYSLLTGETKDRAGAIETFQSGLVSVFLISLKAGGVGLNLTAADTVILFDPWWNPAVEEQAIDRAYRIGQDKPVFVYRLIASQTIEEKMDELKAKKRALANSVFEPGGEAVPVFTEQDVDGLFDS